MIFDLKDFYKTIRAPSEGLYKEKGSKFIAFAKAVFTESEFQEFQTEVKQLHNKARHHCYGFRIGIDGEHYRANDDGEPSGTAGKPILGQIDSNELTNIAIIVIRYFGGTKLGTGGLIVAYRSAAKAALENSVIIKKEILTEFKIAFDYKWMNGLLGAVKKIDAIILFKEFNAKPFLHIGIPRSKASAAIHRLKALILKKSLEEVSFQTGIEGFEIEKLD